MSKWLFLMVYAVAVGCAVPEGRSAGDLPGDWSIESVHVAFLDDEGVAETVPATVYPDRDEPVQWVDGSRVAQVRFGGSFAFGDDGALSMHRHIVVDGAVTDEDSDGVWQDPDLDSIVMDFDEGLRIPADVEWLDDRRVRLTWDREAPEFLDASCVLWLVVQR